MRIIADHARASTFLISDGVLPSNEGRGYVLRLIMRRALYHGQTLGLEEPFLYKMAGHVAQMMKGAYPELAEGEIHIAAAIKAEEDRYAHTTRVGLERLDQVSVVDSNRREVEFVAWKQWYSDFTRDKKDLVTLLKAGELPFVEHLFKPSQKSPPPPDAFVWIPGEDLFKLHDTFGLRPDFIEDVVKNYGLTIDREGYEAEMQRQRDRARSSWKAVEKSVAKPAYAELAKEHRTRFLGYETTKPTKCRVVGFYKLGVEKLMSEASDLDTDLEIILDPTPFYAEAGGQVGDTGWLSDEGGEFARVEATYAPVTGVIAHRIKWLRPRHLTKGDAITAEVDGQRRDAIRRNHTATHLLHAALRKTLGAHVKQAGSLVAPDRLRFDFTHYAPLGQQDLLDIEDLVNQHVLANEEVHTNITDLETAVNSGAMALFGEKYADRVRVVSIDEFSKELCGGTHVRRTGDIGLFKVLSEASVAAGTRRIEALTGQGVLDALRRQSETLTALVEVLRSKPEALVEAAEKLADSEKKLRKALEAQQLKRAAASAGDLLEQAREVKGVRVVAARVESMDRAGMRQMVDNLRARLRSGVIVLGSAADGKVSLVAAVSKDLTDRLDAGKIVKAAAAFVEGSGGGRKDLAEAGGKNPAKLNESLEAVPLIIEQMLE